MSSALITSNASMAATTSETTATEGVEYPSRSLRPRRKFVGTSAPKASSSKVVRRVANQVPDDILHDAELNDAIRGKIQSLEWASSIIADDLALPGNYNFEIHKTIFHIRRDGYKTVALQMPEGLMMYGCAIADIVER